MRTWLNKIFSSSQLVKTTNLPNSTEKTSKASRSVKEGKVSLAKKSNKPKSLTNNLSDLTHLKEGRLNLTIEPLELQPLLQKTLDEFKPYANSQEVSVSLMQPTASLVVLADAYCLQQIVLNLLSNAVNFSPKGTKVELWVTRSANRVRLMVTDEGEGIPLAFQSRIFERFAQAGSLAAPDQANLGIGLTITRELTTAMCGEIGFSSIPGRGSCFFIELPRASSL